MNVAPFPFQDAVFFLYSQRPCLCSGNKCVVITFLLPTDMERVYKSYARHLNVRLAVT